MTKDHIKFVLLAYIQELEKRGFSSERNPSKHLSHILWMCHKNIEHLNENKSDRKIGSRKKFLYI